MRDIWRHQPGEYFCVSTKSPWKDHFFARHELRYVADFVDRQRGKDVYFCPHGFSGKQRRKEYAVPPTLLYADLDDANPYSLVLRPTIAIQSSPGRFVGIWECDCPVTEQLNRALTYHIGADKGGWDFTQVLRMPGSCNYKYPAAPQVKVLWDDGPDYRVRDIERTVRVISTPVGCSIGTIDWSTVSNLDYWTVAGKYRVRKYLGVRPIKSQDGREDRSATNFWFAVVMREAGASDEDIAAVLPHTKSFQSKYGSELNASARKEIERICTKLENAK